MSTGSRSIIGGSARLGVIAIVLVITMGSVDNASAAPFTSYFDDLIVELESRSAALAGSTDKAEIKLRKGLAKVLKAFAKTSKGPARDLKDSFKDIFA